MQTSSFRIPRINTTRRNIPKHLQFSKNMGKITLRNNQITTIQTKASTLDQDDFMTRYYPKILYVENKVERIMDRHNVKGKHFQIRKERLKLYSDAMLKLRNQPKKGDDI